MTVNEAVSKMQAIVESAKERLEGNGFVMSVETDYMNYMLRPVQDEKKARYVTVALIVGKEGGEKGEEYCMSLGAMITKKGIDDATLETNMAQYETMVNETVETLQGYEDKNEGLDFLTAKANEEYKKLIAKMEEDRKKSLRMSLITNVVFIVGIVLLFMFAFR